MKKISMLLVLLGGLSANSIRADMVTLQQNGAFSNGDGGEFAVYGSTSTALYNAVQANYASTTKNQGGYNNSFQTFCIQSAVTFSPGTSYNYAIINSGVTLSAPVINWGTAWLYSQFAAGTLSGYNYGGTRTTSAGQLQLAIWYLQGQPGAQLVGSTIVANGTTVTGDGWAFYQAALSAATAASANATGASGGAFGVMDLQLYNPDGSQAQAQLIVVPEASTMIAGALLLLPFGASTLRILRKNRTA